MEEHREESEIVGDCREPMEEAKGLGLSSKNETLDGDEVDVPQKESCVEDTCNSVSDDVASGDESSEKTISTGDVDRTDAVAEPDTEVNKMECEGDVVTTEVKPVDEIDGSEIGDDETAKSEVKSQNGESAGEEETVTSGGNEVTHEKANCEVEDNGDACDDETLSAAEDKADQEKESAKKSEEDFNKMEQGNPGSETKDAKHSESAPVPEESTQLSKGDGNKGNPGNESATEISHEEVTTNVNQKEENGEAMEIDYASEEEVEKDVKVGEVLNNAGNESADASMVQTLVVPTAEVDRNDSNVVKEMEIDERKDNANMASDLTGTIESADAANPNSLSEDAATGEAEPLDHNLFDPSSDITNFIDFSGVSSWSGNIQDLKTETGSVSLKEDKKATNMAEEVAMVDRKETLKSHDNLSAEVVENESNEACGAFGAESPAAATKCPREASDAIMGSDENQEDKDRECLDKKTADQQDTMREEDDITHEAPSVDPDQKEDAEMEENPNNSDFADGGTDSDIKTNGVKRKADVLSEDSAGEGRKTVSLAKVSFDQRPSFKIGACIARAASQMAGSPSVLKGSSIGDETLSVESFVSQLHCAATDPAKEHVVSDIAVGFFLDFRNSSASQHVTPEKVSSKRGRPSNSNAGGTEAFEFEEMGDTYWTDRVIHNGGEEQTPPTEKGNYQVVPVELKPAQVKKTRRPYRRRQSQITIPLPSASDKPAGFDENAPAELIMNFSETDTIPPEKSLSKMFRHFGPIRESQTEVDRENNRARVVFRKGADAEVAYNSAGRFNIFGKIAVNYELSFTITEVFKVQPYVVSLGEEDAAVSLPS
ncbi:unnamed protein product [Arabis nemorensis]|uniref:Uncharacterized protein n=1 Tax=Arabis nemorensis TaxID=586526 RepID=A0A565BWE1_9BRAS|nr:unnamed protein product [Arabis nemorensis]